MAAATLIVVACSVPATATGIEFLAAPTAPIRATHLTGTYAADASVQSLMSEAGDPSSFSRDGFTVTEAPPLPPALSQIAGLPNQSLIQWPVASSTRVSGPFGPRIAPCAGCSTFHKGSDLVPGAGTPIHAIGNGVVTAVSATDSSGLGVYAVIEHYVDGRVVSSVYGHMIVGSLQLHVGESVAVGQLVGNVGNTGQSTGAHLHFEILLDGTTPTDPLAWLAANATL
jgi:murein DD-endopeptidase MepM/ murein hydrolase activator NlpD